MNLNLARIASAFGLLASMSLVACAADSSQSGGTAGGDGTAEDDLRVRGTAEWFYSGPMPTLENAQVTVSLKGHTARVTGLLPAGTRLGALPQVRSTAVAGGRIQIDAVYPIATGAVYADNAPAGSYAFQRAVPYRPDGQTFTYSAGNHFVTWGGFPFLAYDGAIALHGPITAETSKDKSQNVWFLKRGTVSSGCNRMNGEHVVEVAQLTGVSMRKAYSANQSIVPSKPASVKVIADYDKFNGKYVDVDFPTDTGVVRPGKVYGAQNVEMFGSWVASELPDGSDLPRDLAWEGGVSGEWYVFADHAEHDYVCSVLPADLVKLKPWIARQPGAQVPANFCAKKDCIVAALADGEEPNDYCK